MASNLYNIGLLRLLNGSTDFLSDNVRGLLVEDTYTFNVSHEYVASVTGDEVGGTNYSRFTLTGKSVSLASNTVTLDCNNPVITALTTTAPVSGVILYEETGVDSTSPLIAFIDTPLTSTDGSDLIIQVSASGLMEVQNNIA